MSQSTENSQSTHSPSRSTTNRTAGTITGGGVGGLNSSISREQTYAQDHQQTLAKLQRNLDELRSRYSAERKELLAASAEHVADARSEMDQTKSLATRCIQRVDAFRRQLRSLESAAQQGASAQSSSGGADGGGGGGGGGNLRATLTTGSERLVHALDGLREATEQTQLLQSAILNDRVRREQRMRQARDEDAELELRLRHLEESNANLRGELAAVKAVNAEAFKSIDKVLEICRPDSQSAIHGSELRNVHSAAVRDLGDVREAVTILSGRVESIDKFSKSEDTRRNQLLEQLERVVQDIESKPPPPSFTPKIQTRQLFGNGSSSNPSGIEDNTGGTFPSVVPKYRESEFPSSSTAGAGSRSNSNSNPSNSAVSYHQDPEARRKAAAQLRAARQAGKEDPSERATGSVFVPAANTSHGKAPSLKNRLMAFYSKFNPSKLNEVDQILGEYEGAEEELMSSLEVHYNAFGYFSTDLKM